MWVESGPALSMESFETMIVNGRRVELLRWWDPRGVVRDSEELEILQNSRGQIMFIQTFFFSRQGFPM